MSHGCTRMTAADHKREAQIYRSWWARWQRWADRLCRSLDLHPPKGLLGDDGMRKALAKEIRRKKRVRP